MLCLDVVIIQNALFLNNYFYRYHYFGNQKYTLHTDEDCPLLLKLENYGVCGMGNDL